MNLSAINESMWFFSFVYGSLFHVITTLFLILYELNYIVLQYYDVYMKIIITAFLKGSWGALSWI